MNDRLLKPRDDEDLPILYGDPARAGCVGILPSNLPRLTPEQIDDRIGHAMEYIEREYPRLISTGQRPR